VLRAGQQRNRSIVSASGRYDTFTHLNKLKIILCSKVEERERAVSVYFLAQDAAFFS
jgi:hypothetical protein